MNAKTNEDKKLIGNKRKRFRPINNPPKKNDKFKEEKNVEADFGLSKELINQNVNIIIESNLNRILLNKDNLNVQKSQKRENNKIKSVSENNTAKIKNPEKKK